MRQDGGRGDRVAGLWSERWAHWKIKSELARGKSAAALATLEDAERRYPASIALRLLGRDLYRETGRDEDAATEMNTIERLILSAPYRYATPEGRLSLGRFFLLRGADARKVLDQFYDVATKEAARPRRRLSRHGRAGAGQAGRRPGGGDAPEGARRPPPRTRGSTTCWPARSRPRIATGSDKALAEALKINPHHVDSLLLQVDHLIDAERYAEAEPLLKRVFDVNPHEPRAFAYQAVLAHLRSDPTGEAAARQSALAPWAKNPEVDSPDRPRARAEVSLRRGGRGPETGARARPRLPARQDPALPGPAPAGRRSRGVEAGRRDLRQGRLQRGRLSTWSRSTTA